MKSEEFYTVSKEMLDEILRLAHLKRDDWYPMNEMYIEADTSIYVVEYIIEHSKLTPSIHD